MTATTTDTVQLLDIDVDDLHPAPDNPRTDLGDLEELAATIRAHGILEPLVAVPRMGLPGFLLAAGHRRLAAAKLAGLTSVPVLVRHDLDDEARRFVMLIENLHREDITPIAEARLYQRLSNEHGLSQRAIAEKVGRNQSHVSKRLKLLDLPDDLQGKVDAGDISVEVGLQLVTLQKDPKRFAKVTKGEISEWQVRSELESLRTELRMAKQRAEYEAKGATIVDRWPNQFLPADLTKARNVALAEVVRKMEVTARKHEKLDCHGVYLDSHGGPIAVCTKPANHERKPEPPESAETAAWREQHEAERRALKDAHDRRQAIAEQLMARLDDGGLDLEDPQLLEHVLLQLLSEAIRNNSDEDAVCALMGIPKRKKTEGHLIWASDWKPLPVEAAENGGLLRAVLATVLVAGDSGPHTGPRNDVHRRHIRLLQQHGYQPTDDELDALNPPTDDDTDGADA